MLSLSVVPAGLLSMLITAAGPSTVPPNLRVDPTLRPVVTHMWETSPTFRAQCARLAEVPELVVAIWYDDRVIRGWRRAATTFVRHAGRLVSAQVRLAHGYDPVELLAHELEHIVEQLDGVDLPTAFLRADNVTRARDGSFETERAIEAGVRVRREVERAEDTPAEVELMPTTAAVHAQQSVAPRIR